MTSRKGQMLIILIWLAFMTTNVAWAGVSVYTERSEFLAATGSPSYAITFETYGDGTSIIGEIPITGYEWLNQGILIETIDAQASMTLEEEDHTWTSSSPTHSLMNWSDAGSNDEFYSRLTFANPVRSAGLVIVDSEFYSEGDSIDVYDARGEMLLSLPIPYYGVGTGGPEANFFLGFGSDTPIGSIVIHEGLDGKGIALDDILYTAHEDARHRQYLLGDIDHGVDNGPGSADEVYIDPDIPPNLIGVGHPIKRFDELGNNTNVPFTFIVDLADGEMVGEADLTVLLKPGGSGVSTDSIWFYSADASEAFGPFSFEDLGWLPLSAGTYEARSLRLSDVAGADMRHLLQEGQLSCQLRDDVSIDYAVLDVQVVPEPATMGLLALGGLVLLRRKK